MNSGRTRSRPNSVVVGGALKEYDGIITGVPTLRAKPIREKRKK
jgi:hypothetical protein